MGVVALTFMNICVINSTEKRLLLLNMRQAAVRCVCHTPKDGSCSFIHSTTCST